MELAAANGCFQFPVLGNAQHPSTSAAGLDLRGVVTLDRDESADVIDACIEETMTALTEAGSGGATLMELRALGGHADVASLQRYVVPDVEAARGAQNKRATPSGKTQNGGNR